MRTVTLGQFSRSGLERYLGSDLAAGVRTAAAHYAAKLRCGRVPVPPARFLLEGGQAGEGVRVEFALDREDGSVLESEAERLEVPLPRLLVHAVLVYLAEMELLGVPTRENDSGGSERS